MAGPVNRGHAARRFFTPRVECLEGRQLLSGIVNVSSSGSVLEGNQASFQIQGSNLPAGGVTVYYETTPGTATAGADYTALSGSVFLAAPSAMVTVNVSTTADAIADPGETFSLTLTSVTGGASIGTGSAGMTINEQGSGPPGPSPQYITLTSPGTLAEGQVFSLSGSVSPAGSYWLSGSINWGGFVTQMGSVVNFGTNSDGSFIITNVYYDDGTSPGNDTTSDVATIVLNVSVSGTQLSAQTTATVQNVVPTTIHPTTGVDQLTLFPSEPGGPHWVLSGTFFDPGLADVHTITINWGDCTPPDIFTQGQGSINRTHIYPPSGETYTVSVTIADDDLGIYNWSKAAPMYLLDLDNDANNNGAIEGIDDPIEDIYPGAYVGVNGDDDDEDNIADLSPLQSVPVENENDLEKFTVRWTPAIRPEANNYQEWWVALVVTPPYTYDSQSQTWVPGGAAIYQNDDKTNPLSFTQFAGGPKAVWPAAGTVEKTLYLEARAAGPISMSLVLLPPLTSAATDTDTVVFTAVNKGVDLQIWHGQSAPGEGGSGFLPEGKGEGTEGFDRNQGALGRGGAFTLANKNDTDNDGRIDNVDDYVVSASTTVTAAVPIGVTVIPVESVVGFSVGDGVWIVRGIEFDARQITAIDPTLKTITINEALPVALAAGAVVTHGGRSEVDLMPLRVVVTGFGEAPGGNVVIKAPSGVKFWTKSYKETQVIPNAQGEITISAAEAADGTLRLLWVELTSESANLGDVRISAKYDGFTDVLDATGVWVERLDVEHDNASEVWTDAPPGLFNETPPFGLIPRHPVPGVGDVFMNGIGFQFVALPRGVYDQPIVKVDAARHKTRTVWKQLVAGGGFDVVEVIPWPVEAERPNDDEKSTDESAALNVEDHFYSYDTPGISVEAVSEKSYVGNFYEWVRIAFGSERPAGNVVAGSRASIYYSWTCSHRLVFMDGALRRSTGDDIESAENNIKIGHKDPLTRPGS